jgi:hypothetical protein
VAGNGAGRGNPAQMVTPNSGGIVRHEYTGLEMQKSAEMAAAASAAYSEALVKASHAMALQVPRDIERARQNVLLDCKRPAFAERAIYSKPVGGKKIEGPSVRLAESLVRAWGNLTIEAVIIYDDLYMRKIHVCVKDVEKNVTSTGEVLIEKTVERSNPTGRHIISERTNSSGARTYLVAATEDELLNKTNATISKMRRNKTLEMIPDDIVQEAMEVCRATMKDADAKNPDEAKRRMLDAFAEIGVDVDDVREYLGRDNLDKLTPAELADLRKAYAAIDTGESTWGQLVELRETQRKAKVSAPVAPPPPPAQGAPGSAAPAPTGAQPAEAAPQPEEPKPTEAPAPTTAQPTSNPAPAPAPAPKPPADDTGNKLADDVIAQMRAAASGGDKKKVIAIASEAAKDKRIPQERRKEIGDKFAELSTLASENAKRSGGA